METIKRSRNGKPATRPPPAVRTRKTVKVFPETKRKLDIIVAAEATTMAHLLDEMIDARYRMVLSEGLLELDSRGKGANRDAFLQGYGELWPPAGLVATKTIHVSQRAKQKADIVAAAYGLSLADALGRITCLRYAELIRSGGLPEVGVAD